MSNKGTAEFRRGFHQAEAESDVELAGLKVLHARALADQEHQHLAVVAAHHREKVALHRGFAEQQTTTLQKMVAQETHSSEVLVAVQHEHAKEIAKYQAGYAEVNANTEVLTSQLETISKLNTRLWDRISSLTEQFGGVSHKQLLDMFETALKTRVVGDVHHHTTK